MSLDASQTGSRYDGSREAAFLIPRWPVGPVLLHRAGPCFCLVCKAKELNTSIRKVAHFIPFFCHSSDGLKREVNKL